MSRNQSLISICILSTYLSILAPATHAQGLSEYGSVLGSQGKPGGSGLQNAVKKLYGQGSGAPTPTKSIDLDPEDVQAYGKQANQCYLAGQKLQKAGKTDAAIDQYGRAILIREKIWGGSDPALPILIKLQADLYRKKGRLHDAETDYRKLLGLQAKSFGPGSPESEKTASILAQLCEQQKHYKDAAGFYSQVLALRLKAEGADSPKVRAVRMKLATAQFQAEDYPSAEQSLKDALASEEQSTKPDHELQGKLLDSYISLLEKTNRQNEVAGMQQRKQSLGMPAPAQGGAAAPAGK